MGGLKLSLSEYRSIRLKHVDSSIWYSVLGIFFEIPGVLSSPVCMPIRTSTCLPGWCRMGKVLTDSSRVSDIRAISDECLFPLSVGRPDTAMYASPIVSTWSRWENKSKRRDVHQVPVPYKPAVPYEPSSIPQTLNETNESEIYMTHCINKLPA